MNPIANLPATQNLNKAQQSQGYNRQYFGGDEVDEVVLSNQEEQKKKKAWTIGLTTLGTIALAVGAFVGLSATGCTKKGADNLKGFTQLTQGEGESATKLATIAKTDKSWTGATWGGVAETIKTTLDDSKTFGTIVIVATKENQKKLEDKLGKEFINKHSSTLIFRAEDDITNVAKKYGEKKDTLILVDSSKDDWFDRIEKEITSLNKPATPPNTEEGKKDIPPATGEVREESASASVPKTKQYYGLELNSITNAQQIFSNLKKDIQKASNDLKKFELPGSDNKEVQPYQFINDFTNNFEPQFRNAMNLAKTANALKTYCTNKIEELKQDNAKCEKKLKDEFSNEKKEEKLKQCTDDDNKTKIVNEFDEQKKNIENKIAANNKALADLKSISSYKVEKTPLFANLHQNVEAIAETLQSGSYTNKNDLTSNIQKNINSLQSNIESLQGTLNEQNEQLSNLKKQQKEKQEEDDDLSSNIQKLTDTIAQNSTKLDNNKSQLKDNKNSLEETQKALKKLFDTYCTLKIDSASIAQQEELQQARKIFEYSISSDKPINEAPRYRTSFFDDPPYNIISDGDEQPKPHEELPGNND